MILKLQILRLFCWCERSFGLFHHIQDAGKIGRFLFCHWFRCCYWSLYTHRWRRHLIHKIKFQILIASANESTDNSFRNGIFDGFSKYIDGTYCSALAFFLTSVSATWIGVGNRRPGHLHVKSIISPACSFRYIVSSSSGDGSSSSLSAKQG